MTRSPEEKKEALAEVQKKLKALLEDADIKSHAGLKKKLKEIRSAIKAGKKPEEPTQDIAAADKDLYNNALLALANEYLKKFPPELDTKAKNYFKEIQSEAPSSIEELGKYVGKKMAEIKDDSDIDDPELEMRALKLAARGYREIKGLKRDEAVVEKGRWSLGLWPDYYKKYRDKFDSRDDADKKAKKKFISDSVKELVAKDWESLKEVDFEKLLTLALATDELIEVMRETLGETTKEEIEDIEQDLEELQKHAEQMGDKEEAKVVPQRLKAKLDQVKGQWLSNLDRGFYERAQDVLSPNELKKYQTFYNTLKNMDGFINNKLIGQEGSLTTPLGELPEETRNRLKRWLQTIRDYDYNSFLQDNRLNESDRVRLQAIHDRVIQKAGVILGTETDKPDWIFTEDIKWWIFAHCGISADEADYLWHIYQSGHKFLLEDDKDELKHIQQALKDGMKAAYEDREDVAFNQRVTALGILLNRVEKMEEAVEEVAAKSVEGNKEIASEFLDKKEFTSMTGQELYRHALNLIDILNSDFKPYTTDEREDDRKLWNKKLIPELKSRSEIVIYRDDTELKTTGERLAQYLQDRLVFDAMTNYASTSAFSMNPKDVIEGWGSPYGAKIASFFNEGHIIRLLYGQDFKTNRVLFEQDEDKLDSESDLERERINSVNTILEFACEEFNKDNNPPSSQTNDPKLRGDFHATKKFEENGLKPKLINHLKERWINYLSNSGQIQESGTLTFEQEADFSLAINMMVFLDLRTYYMLPFYVSGTSPVDAVRSTIGEAAKIYLNGKGMYYVCGKGEQMVNPALLVSEYSDKTQASCDRKYKLNNLRFSINHATPIWRDWHAPSLDEGLDSSAKDRIAFKRKDGELMVPSLSAFWLPHLPGEAQASSSVDTRMRDGILSAAGKKDVPYDKDVSLFDLLQGAEHVANFVEDCESGFKPSGDMLRDAEKLIGEATTKRAHSISPTKSLPTVNTRYLANNLYLFARTSLLAFSKEYGMGLDSIKKDKNGLTEYGHYKEAFFTFLENMTSSLRTAPTTQITINEEIPSEFRAKFGLPQEEDIKIVQYVLALLPLTDKYFFNRKRLRSSGDVSNEVASKIIASVQADRLRIEHNEEELSGLAQQEEPLRQAIRNKIRLSLLGGSGSRVLHKQFEPVSIPGPNGQKSFEFYRAMEILPLSKQGKQAEGEQG